MDNFLLLVMATSGLCVVSSHVGCQYYIFHELKNMTEAQSYCREKYTDLATIDNMEDVNILNNMVDLNKMVYPGSRAWIGLYDDLDSWRWSLSDTSFYKHGEAQFRRWYAAEPNNLGSGENCTVIDDSGLWFDTGCHGPFKAVCFDVRGSNVTFVFINKSMTWTEAQSYCREHHTDLASVRNMTENQKVKELVPAEQNVWIGLFRDSWKWLDGSSSSFRHWISEEPNNGLGNEACAVTVFSHFGRWGDWPCDWKEPFICQSLPKTTKQVFKVKLQKKSSLDLNDPAVMEQMLNQLKQKLKDQGVTGDVKLSWRKQPDGKVFHKEKKKTKKRNTCTKKDEL